jgi:isoquinoline 1-oxidoreductase alpha subunit
MTDWKRTPASKQALVPIEARLRLNYAKDDEVDACERLCRLPVKTREYRFNFDSQGTVPAQDGCLVGRESACALRAQSYPCNWGVSCRGSLPDREVEMLTLRVNGENFTFAGDPSMPLLWFLRDELGLTGTKFGCGVAACGACTVHLDGEAVRACQTSLADVGAKAVTTIEGLDPAGEHPVQRAWRAGNVAQCGYCQAGQIMQAVALLKQSPRPTDAEIDNVMFGNICRCGTYQRIRAAIKQAAGV